MNEEFSESDFDEAFDTGEDEPMPPMMRQTPMGTPQPQQPAQPQSVPQMMPQPPASSPPPPQMRSQTQSRPQQPQFRQPQQRPQFRQPQRAMSPFVQPMVFPLPPGLSGEAPEAFYQKKVAGLPVWAWGALAVVGGGVAYFTMRDEGGKSSKAGTGGKLKRNGSPDEGHSESDRSGWEPSRSRFAEALSRKYGGKIEKVYSDADEAQGVLKTVSPLINIKAKSGFSVDKGFESFCKSEGLHPVAHEDNEIGIYPADGTSKGRAWEDYVDALRDDGQKV